MNDKQLQPKRERHGMNKSPEHASWVQMKQRCLNPKRKDYKWYGAKGVTVCAEWLHSFIAFYAHIGPKPTPKHTLDRIDVKKGYEPGNVRWLLQAQQLENTTVARLVTIDGVTKTISAWERAKGLAKGQVRMRENLGWTTEKAILTPSVAGRKTRGRGASIVRAAASLGGQKP